MKRNIPPTSRNINTTLHLEMYTLEASGAFKIDDPQQTYIYDIISVGAVIAAISSDDCLRLIDPLSLYGQPIEQISKVHAEVTCLKALDGENSIVCTAGRDGNVKIHDLRLGQTESKIGDVRTGRLLNIIFACRILFQFCGNFCTLRVHMWNYAIGERTV